MDEREQGDDIVDLIKIVKSIESGAVEFVQESLNDEIMGIAETT